MMSPRHSVRIKPGHDRHLAESARLPREMPVHLLGNWKNHGLERYYIRAIPTYGAFDRPRFRMGKLSVRCAIWLVLILQDPLKLPVCGCG